MACQQPASQPASFCRGSAHLPAPAGLGGWYLFFAATLPPAANLPPPLKSSTGLLLALFLALDLLAAGALSSAGLLAAPLLATGALAPGLLLSLTAADVPVHRLATKACTRPWAAESRLALPMSCRSAWQSAVASSTTEGSTGMRLLVTDEAGDQHDADSTSRSATAGSLEALSSIAALWEHDQMPRTTVRPKSVLDVPACPHLEAGRIA